MNQRCPGLNLLYSFNTHIFQKEVLALDERVLALSETALNLPRRSIRQRPVFCLFVRSRSRPPRLQEKIALYVCKCKSIMH